VPSTPSERSTDIRAVLFDFYGTLARATSWGPAFEELLARRGLQLSPEAHDRWRDEVFDGQEHYEHSRSRDHYESWERERLRRLVSAAAGGTHFADTEQLVGELFAARRDFRMEAYPDAAPAVGALRARGIAVAVCSNWGWDLDQALAQAGLDGCFDSDAVVTSARVGVRKPHPAIFEQTLAAVGAAPEHAAFVGDTWYPDVEGALGAGMRPVHVWRDDASGGTDPPELTADVVRVRDLSAVAALA
jgi:putative hydrolase of the HAD superfamily